MEKTRILDHDAPSLANSAEASAEKIVRDAETREGNSPSHEESPQVRETTSSYLGMTRKEAPPVAEEPPVAEAAREHPMAPAEDNPAPFSSALGIPTLVNESSPSSRDAKHQAIGRDEIEPGSRTSEDNPAPFSSALGIPTLINESSTPSRDTER